MDETHHGCPNKFNQTTGNMTDLRIFLAYTIPMIPLAFCVIVGNSMVIAAVYRKRALRTPTNLILTSLAIADLLTGLVACPLQSFALYEIFTPQATTSIVLTLPYVVFSGIAFLHIVAVTVDRHIAITRPLRYASLVTHKRVGLGIVVMWVLCVVGFAIRTTVSVVKNRSDGWAIICEADEFETPLARVQTWSILAFISVLTPVLVVFNVRILNIAMKQSKAISGQQNVLENIGHQGLQDGRLKAVKTTAMVVGVFLMCWIPIYAYFVVQLADIGGTIFRDVLAVAGLLSVVLSSAVNPCIYCYRVREFRRAFLCKSKSKDNISRPQHMKESSVFNFSGRSSRALGAVADTDVNYNCLALIQTNATDNLKV